MKIRLSLITVSLLTAGILSACSGQRQTAQESTAMQTDVVTAQETVLQDTTNVKPAAEAGQNTGDTSIISEDKAKKIALDDAGVKENDVTGIRVKLEMDDGRQEYEVDFYAGTKEYDYKIAAADGAILEKDYDIEYDFEGKNNDKSSETFSREDAIALVLSKVNGATESDVRIHLDTDDGREIYEGSVIYKAMEYDFEIDAQTGSVIEWEAESIYD